MLKPVQPIDSHTPEGVPRGWNSPRCDHHVQRRACLRTLADRELVRLRSPSSGHQWRAEGRLATPRSFGDQYEEPLPSAISACAHVTYHVRSGSSGKQRPRRPAFAVRWVCSRLFLLEQPQCGCCAPVDASWYHRRRRGARATCATTNICAAARCTGRGTGAALANLSVARRGGPLGHAASRAPPHPPRHRSPAERHDVGRVRARCAM